MHPKLLAKRLTKKFLSRFGLEMARSHGCLDLEKYHDTETSGRILEFVGISGVGKSTLFAQSISVNSNRWFFERHAVSAKTPKNVCPEHERALKQVLAMKCAGWTNSNINLSKCCEILTRQSNVLRASTNITWQRYPRGFALDEGVSHYFAEQIINDATGIAKQLLKGRAFVYIRPHEPKALLHQIRNSRHRKYPQEPPLPDLDSTQCKTELATLKEQCAIYDRLWATIQNLGLDGIQLTLEDGMEKNRAAILDFEKRLLAN